MIVCNSELESIRPLRMLMVILKNCCFWIILIINKGNSLGKLRIKNCWKVCQLTLELNIKYAQN
jgi:hypothetical protein